jgi:hypothetical protein
MGTPWCPSLWSLVAVCENLLWRFFWQFASWALRQSDVGKSWLVDVAKCELSAGLCTVKYLIHYNVSRFAWAVG